MTQIVLAMQNYESSHKKLPPAYLADADGKPMHSWRVLLLPYLEEQELYEKYRFDEPWDGPNNRKLHTRILRVYQCLLATGPATETSYVVVTGKGTAFTPGKSRTMNGFPDGTGQTILLVEVHNSGIHWMEPRDLSIDEIVLAINPPQGKGISSAHPGGAMVVFADGTRRFLPNTTKAAEISALLSPAGQDGDAAPMSDSK